jgi:uncharacterized protein (DUF433 family)
MQLPPFLTADDGGFIHARGHRIGLTHLVRRYKEGYTPEMLQAYYPTLSLALIHKIIAFYLENEADVDAYMATQDREVQRQIAAARPSPTLAELRKRLEAKRRAEVQQAQPATGQ